MAAFSSSHIFLRDVIRGNGVFSPTFFLTTFAKHADRPVYVYAYSKQLLDQNESWSFNTRINTGDKALIHMRTQRILIALTCRIPKHL
jgi:hypothetical protein